MDSCIYKRNYSHLYYYLKYITFLYKWKRTYW